MSTKPPAPPPPSTSTNVKRSPKSTIPEAIPLQIVQGQMPGGDRIVVYGTGGIGKTTLASWLPAPMFLDLQKGTRKISLARDIVSTWPELRGKIAGFLASPPPGARTLVIDDISSAEEFAKEHVVATRLTDKGKRVDSIDGFGWGNGWQFVYDEFVALLADLDRVSDAGFNVCLVAHDVAVTKPNPSGEDFLQYQPLLYGGDKRGRANVRSFVKNWCEHLLFIGYDVFVEEGSNKGTGVGTRQIYTQELPTHLAKSRSAVLTQTFTLDNPGAIWTALVIK